MIDEALLHHEVPQSEAFAAASHMVEEAQALAPETLADLWIDIGYLYTAERDEEIPDDEAAASEVWLRRAEQAALRTLISAELSTRQCADLALACVAFAGHRVGRMLWNHLAPPELSIELICPGCDAEIDSEIFPVGLGLPRIETPDAGPWGAAVALVEQARDSGGLDAAWSPFLDIAAAVAAAGVPADAPAEAVLCLVAVIVAVRSTPRWAGLEWARELLKLTGGCHCDYCGNDWTVADCSEARREDARPLADSTQETPLPASALPAPRPVSVETYKRTLLSSEGSGIDAVALIARAGHPTLVAGGGNGKLIHLWDLATGEPYGKALTGHPDRIRTLAAVPLSDGRTLLASGGDSGAVGLWDPYAPEEESVPLQAPVGNATGALVGICAVPMPDGRTLFATATDRGWAKLRDPLSTTVRGGLNPRGRDLTAIIGLPLAAGHTAVAAVARDREVHLWDPQVSDPWDAELSPTRDRPVGELIAAVPDGDRALLAIAGRDGSIALWDPATWKPIGVTLPPDPTKRAPVAMVGTTHPDGRVLVVVCASDGRSLRVWEPGTDDVVTVEVGVTVTALAAEGGTLIVGHRRGAITIDFGP